MFIDEQLPPKIARCFRASHDWDTDVVASKARIEQRNQVLEYPLGHSIFDHAIKKPETIAPLRHFRMVMRGRAYLWRFKDWNEYQAADVPIGTGDTAQATFQPK